MGPKGRDYNALLSHRWEMEKKVQCIRVCNGVKTKLQRIDYVADFLAFCLDGEDVEWLESLRNIKDNFKDSKLRIKEGQV